MSIQPPFVPANKVLKSYTRAEVAKHSSKDSLWTVIDSYVFDLTKFYEMHPGGASVLLNARVAGIDSSEAFFGLHRSDILIKYQRLLVGKIEGEGSTYSYPTPGALSLVPNAEPAWLTDNYKSPYFTKQHKALALAMRKFVDEEIVPEAKVHELNGKPPSDALIKKMGERHMLAMRLGPGKHLHGLVLPGGMKGEDYDYMAELVVTQEIARIAARGYQDGLSAGMWIGLTPILNYGSAAQKAQYIPQILRGDKKICLAISEPFAGSDVSGIMTTAVLTADKKHYTVNGAKKWITNSVGADFATTTVQTPEGMCMIIIDLASEGVDVKKIATSYSSSAGTGYISFDDVLVPAENILGTIGKGFLMTVANFSHERLVMVHFTARQIRAVTEQAFIWAHLRKVFGKSLIEQPVIRAKFGEMFAKCDAVQAQLEFITYQMDQLSYQDQAMLAGPIALLKTYATRCACDIADQSVQIFGGRGLTKGGLGGMIEMFQRTYKFDAILGGSEEILADLGVRQASRKMPKAVL